MVDTPPLVGQLTHHRSGLGGEGNLSVHFRDQEWTTRWF